MLDKLFDLRFVIGAFFFAVGLMIWIYSFVTEAIGETINRACGTLFLLFGILMIVLSFQHDATDEVLDADGEMSNVKPE